jgi:hypothetical protein
MTIAIMQPYIFPYIGYFQLINAVDKFIIYDDVNFINKGFINRNRILVAGQPHLFTIPLKDASQNKLIHEVELSTSEPWRKKLLKTIQQSYQKAPNFSVVFPLLEEILHHECSYISELATFGMQRICSYMGIQTEIVSTSRIYGNAALKAADRILDICKQNQTEGYINPIGGLELYDKEVFEAEQIQLQFIKSKECTYTQYKNEFVPWLSIIDVLMFVNKENFGNLLTEYELI